MLINIDHTNSISLQQLIFPRICKLGNTWEGLYTSGPQLFYCHGPVNVWHYYRGPETGCSKIIPAGKLDGVYVFAVMVHSVTSIHLALRKDSSCVAWYQLIYRLAMVHSQVAGTIALSHPSNCHLCHSVLEYVYFQYCIKYATQEIISFGF